MAVKHSTTATGADDPTKEINKGEWNADHTVDDNTFVAAKLAASVTDVLFGRSTSGAGAGEEVACTAFARSILDDANEATFKATVNLEIGTDVQAQNAFLQDIADLTDPNADRGMFWDDSAGEIKFFTFGSGLTMTDTTLTAAGSATLNGISAADGDQAGISNGDNNIRWNWQKTTNSEIAFEFGESAASTNGTSTSGVPNQVLLKLSTLATSTMSPFSVYTRGNHVFSVSPTARQLLAFEGTAGNASYGFAASVGSGMFLTGAGRLSFSAGTTHSLMIDNFNFASPMVQVYQGSTTVPGLSDLSNKDFGFSWTASGTVSLVHTTNGQVVSWKTAAATGGVWQIMDEADANPTTTELDSLDSVAIYNKANKLVFAYNNAGTITYISIPLDGSTTTWTHSTSAP